MTYTIKQGHNKFYIGNDENSIRVEMTFVPTGETKIIVDHTVVEDEFRGQGVGDILLDKTVAYARENGLKIIPLCPFVKARIEKFPDKYKDILG